MKALTIWQPWASLAVKGKKHYETRGWRTNYRGPIAIHAAKKKPSLCFEILDKKTVRAVMRALNIQGLLFVDNAFPVGKVIGYAELTDCIEITPEFAARLPEEERLFGDYTPGRYAWRLEKVTELEHPVTASGKQGLWDWSPQRKGVRA